MLLKGTWGGGQNTADFMMKEQKHWAEKNEISRILSDTFRCPCLLVGVENNVSLGSNALLPIPGGCCTLCHGSGPRSKEVCEQRCQDSGIYESRCADPSYEREISFASLCCPFTTVPQVKDKTPRKSQAS